MPVKLSDSRAAMAGNVTPVMLGPMPLVEYDPASDDRIMEDPVHQCPYCELRFAYHNEVKDHVVRDHPDRAEAFVSIELHQLPH